MTSPNSTKTTLMLSALLMAVSAFASRILGYFRDVIIATKHGATGETDAYFAAFTLPDTLVYFLAGGALSIAFVPIYQRALIKDGRLAAQRLFRNIASVGGSILGVGVIIGFIFADAFVARLFPNFTPEQMETTTYLSRILLPGPIFFFLGGLIGATEIAEKRFRSTALAPLIYNLCIILSGLFLSNLLGVSAFAWGALVGSILGPFGTNLLYARKNLNYVPLIDLRSPELANYYYIALPLMVGVSLTTVDEWIGRYFASGLDAGSISWLNNARRLMLFPIALIGQAIGQAALPWLSQLASEGKEDDLFHELSKAVSSTGLLSSAVAAGLASLATIAVAFVYGYGAYTPKDVVETGALLALLCLAIPAWSMQAVVARAFYARSHTWSPMIASTLAVVIAVPIYSHFSARFGVDGIAMATGLAMSLQLGVLLVFHSFFYKRNLWWTSIRSVVLGLAASMPGAAIAYYLSTRVWTLESPWLATVGIAAGAGVIWLILSLPLLIVLGGEAAAPVQRRLLAVREKIYSRLRNKR